MLRFFCTVQDKKQIASRIRDIASVNLQQFDLSQVKNLMTYTHDVYSKELAAKQRSLFNKITNKLIENNNLPQLLSLLPLSDGKLQSKAAVEASQEYLVNSIPKMNTYQKCLAAYWLSRYRHCKMLNTLNSIYDEIDRINDELLSDQATIMISYAQLMDIQRKDIDVKTVNSNILPRLQQQIALYLSKQKMTDEAYQQYRYRSTLQTEVECTLAALSLKPERQVVVLNTYCVDFKCLETYIDIHGPSHYLPWHELKGSEIVRQRNMAKHNIEYKMIDHKEWSKLKGIRQQVAFIKKLLGKL